MKWLNIILNGRMMVARKVMIGCGTRPEIIRLAAVIKRCREYFDCCVVYYNQNWDRNLEYCILGRLRTEEYVW